MDDQLTFLDPIEPLTFELETDLDIASKTAHNAALDAAIASVNSTVLNGPDDLVVMARALLDAVAAELGGLKL